MFGIFKKKKEFDVENYVRGMISGNSWFNVRDEMSLIIGHVIKNKGYAKFVEGMIFLNSEWSVGWAHVETNDLVIKSDGAGNIICSVSVANAMTNEECAFYADDLADIGQPNDMEEDVSDHFLKMFSNGVCEVLGEKSEQFRNLRRM